MICTFAAATYAAVLNTVTVNNTANVKATGMGVFIDAACTQPLLNIAWGDILRGTSKTFNFWVRSESGNPDNIYVTWNTTGLPLGFNLSATTNGIIPWDPAPNYRSLYPMQIMECQFTLSIARDTAVQAYNWYTSFSGSTTPP